MSRCKACDGYMEFVGKRKLPDGKIVEEELCYSCRQSLFIASDPEDFDLTSLGVEADDVIIKEEWT